MRASSASLGDTLRGGSFNRELVGDVNYGSTRTLQDVPITNWSLNGDVTADIKTSAEVSIAYSGDFAESVTPRKLTDALAPFGAEMTLYMLIGGGVFTERVKMGTYRIESVPKATDVQMRLGGAILTVGSTVDLQLLDRFHKVKRNPFRSLEQIPSLVSAWTELARLTGLQVTRNVPDVAIPATTVYPRERLAAVQMIAAVLGGDAFMTSAGTVSIIPTTPGAAVTTLEIGEQGVVLDVEYSMQSEDVYNCVYLDTETDDGIPIHAEAAITTGPLAVTGEYDYNSVEYPNDKKAFIKTQAAADAAVAAELAKVSTVGNFEVPLQCVLDPRLELGDVTKLERMDSLITGRVRKYTMGRTGPMSLTLGVLSDVPN
jgi:hypothetical protein